MKMILTIFKKEWVDTIRDRRTIIAMVIIPLLLIPLAMGLVMKMAISQSEKAQQRTLRMGLITRGNAGDFVQSLARREGFRVVIDFSPDSAQTLIEKDSLDVALVFREDFDERIAANQAGELTLYYRSTDDENITRRRMRDLLDNFENDLLESRFTRLGLSPDAMEALQVTEMDIASTQEKVGKIIGGFLPYMFVIFCFMGSMYPAIDLGAGEKERGTLETLLASPASRFQILMGKFSVVSLAGVTSAGLAILGIYVGIQRIADIPDEILATLMNILEPQSIIMLLSLLLPLTAFFAAVLLGLSIFARSFKEAQSIITPLNILVILPAAVGLFPGVDLNFVTAFVPVLNVSLATKDILAGTIHVGYLATVYVSLFALAGASLWICSKWFGREATIFRM